MEGSNWKDLTLSKFFEVGIIPRLGRKVNNVLPIREKLFISLDIYSLGSERP